MLQLEFINSPDPEILGTVSYGNPRLIIGTSQNDDIIICDPKINPAYFTMEVKENGVICYNNIDGIFYLSNGKKISGRKLHKVGDTIKIGDTFFKILSHTPEKNISRTETLKTLYTEKIKKDSHMEKILNFLKQELLLLQWLLLLEK